MLFRAVSVLRSRGTKLRRRTRYTILDNMDEQERVELRPHTSVSPPHTPAGAAAHVSSLSLLSSAVKHRSTEHNCSLMLSESELDSEQDTPPSQDGAVRSRTRVQAAGAAHT